MRSVGDVSAWLFFGVRLCYVWRWRSPERSVKVCLSTALSLLVTDVDWWMENYRTASKEGVSYAINCGAIVELCGAYCQSHLSFVFLAGTKNVHARKSMVLLDF